MHAENTWVHNHITFHAWLWSFMDIFCIFLLSASFYFCFLHGAACALFILHGFIVMICSIFNTFLTNRSYFCLICGDFWGNLHLCRHCVVMLWFFWPSSQYVSAHFAQHNGFYACTILYFAWLCGIYMSFSTLNKVLWSIMTILWASFCILLGFVGFKRFISDMLHVTGYFAGLLGCPCAAFIFLRMFFLDPFCMIFVFLFGNFQGFCGSSASEIICSAGLLPVLLFCWILCRLGNLWKPKVSWKRRCVCSRLPSLTMRMVGGEASGVRGGREVREAEAVRSETASVCRKRSLRTGNIWKMHAGALEDGGGEGVCKSVYLHACVCAKRRRAIIRPQIVTLPSQKSPPPGPREDHGVELRRERLWPRSRTDAFYLRNKK